jgi:hypothetical protein
MNPNISGKCKICEKPPVKRYNGLNGMPEVLLCKEHDDEAEYPKRWCDGCPSGATVLTVGKSAYSEMMKMEMKPYTVAAHLLPNTYSRLAMCESCGKAQKCKACFTPAYHEERGLLRGATLVGIGNPRCSYCSADQVTDAGPYLQQARNWMAEWCKKHGEQYPVDIPGFSVRLVAPGELAGLVNVTEKGTVLGVCRAVFTKGRAESYTIMVLSHMRRVAFLETLIHELTHVWIYENNLAGKPIVEGFCNWAAVQFLNDLEGTDPSRKEEAACRRAFMLENRDKHYGGDMKALILQAKSPFFKPFKALRDS